MKHSIKFKITFLYTCIITITLFVILGGAFLYSEYYSVTNIQSELEENVVKLSAIITSDLNISELPKTEIFYDDGIMLSVYDEYGNYINGILPEKFPKDYYFEDNIQRITHADNEYWSLFDKKITLDNGEIFWIRGIYSENFAAMFNNRLVLVLAFVIPCMIIITAFICYRMISRVLMPVSAITDTVNEISGTKNLSKRLPILEIKDEIAYLTDTFNGMLETLEDTFEAEKQFTSDAAHELRTPLFVIIAHCEYCLEELNLESEVKEELTIIYNKANTMSKLVSQLLMMTRAESHAYSPVFENVDLKILTELVIEELEEKASTKNIKINLVMKNDDIVMNGDQILLTRMFINLIDNAISYGKSGGYVTVSIVKQDSNIYISVEDNGIGIEENELDKIWNRFYRGDKSRTQTEGFGLGLFMVHWIVNIHGGTIDVKSMPDKGTCFNIKF